MFEYLPELMKGLHTSLTLTVASLIVALILALIFTIILTLKTPVLVWLVLLKDTALVSLISVNDLMLQTKSIATRTQEPFNWYIIAAAIYLVITLLSQYILKRIDQRATRFERRPG